MALADFADSVVLPAAPVPAESGMRLADALAASGERPIAAAANDTSARDVTKRPSERTKILQLVPSRRSDVAEPRSRTVPPPAPSAPSMPPPPAMMQRPVSSYPPPAYPMMAQPMPMMQPMHLAMQSMQHAQMQTAMTYAAAQAVMMAATALANVQRMPSSMPPPAPVAPIAPVVTEAPKSSTGVRAYVVASTALMAAMATFLLCVLTGARVEASNAHAPVTTATVIAAPPATAITTPTPTTITNATTTTTDITTPVATPASTSHRVASARPAPPPAATTTTSATTTESAQPSRVATPVPVSPSATSKKLEDAARSAQMLRQQLDSSL